MSTRSSRRNAAPPPPWDVRPRSARYCIELDLPKASCCHPCELFASSVGLLIEDGATTAMKQAISDRAIKFTSRDFVCLKLWERTERKMSHERASLKALWQKQRTFIQDHFQTNPSRLELADTDVVTTPIQPSQATEVTPQEQPTVPSPIELTYTDPPPNKKAKKRSRK